MLTGRAALAALVAAGLLAVAYGRSLAEAPAQPPAPAQHPAPTEPPAAAQPPAQSPAPTQPPTTVQPPAGSEESIPKTRLVSILGREVTNRDGDGGRVIDVLVDLDGRSGAVVVEFGGFMGIGSRKVCVDWNALRFVRDGKRSSLLVDINRDQIRDTPEYKPNEPPTVILAK